MADRPIVLASGSPRRRELMDRLGVSYDVVAPDIDESVLAGEEPVAYVQRLSYEKAVAVRPLVGADAVVIAADTTVDLDGRILGKPDDADDARAMLRAMSGRTHRVHTGVTVSVDGRHATGIATTLVTFTPITASALEWYVATGEPFGKAGGYGLQGSAEVFVSALKGSVSNVIGLPLTTLVELARSLGVDLVG